MSSRRHLLCTTALGLVLGCAGPAAAEVVLDGTTGPAGSLPGPAFDIPHTLGQQRGGNLFHSFERFSVRRGESATFTGPSGIDNVISRVTGGDFSKINGRLASTIPGADFFFLNPAGVVFGPEASLDVDGSFHVSTADELRFNDGSIFSASDPSASSFTVAAPEAFGFLGAEPGAITVDRGRLEVGTGETLSLVGGDITVSAGNAGRASGGDSGRLRAEAGQIILTAVGGPGAVALADGETTATQLSDIHLTDEAFIDVSGDDGGTVRIRGGQLVVENESFIFADSDGPTDATGGISVDAAAVVVSSGSAITTDVLGSGDGGQLIVRTGELEIDGGSFITSDTFATGDAGGVTVEAGRLSINGAGSGSFTGISSDAIEGSGAAAAVTVTAVELELLDGGRISSSTFAAGDAGRVTVDAQRLQIIGGEGPATAIFSDTFSEGAAGAVTVMADRLSIDGGDSGSFTGISSDALEGAAGTVIVHADDLTVRDGGVISSSSSAGDAGVVTVEAERLLLEGSARNQSVIGSETVASGDGGRVGIKVGDLVIIRGGEIRSLTFGEGDAGPVSVEADRLLIDGAGSKFITGIASEARVLELDDGTEIIPRGASGAVTVRAGAIQVLNSGAISTDTSGVGDAGDVTVTASGVELRDGGSIESSGLAFGGRAGDVLVTADTLRVSNATIETEGQAAEGGRIVVTADRLIHLIDAEVTSSGIEPGEGDSIITLQAPTIVLNGSQVESLTGDGDPIPGSGEARLLGDLTVISPDSDVAASSSVEVSGLESDITAGIEVLPGAFFDVSGQLRGSCAARQSESVSSFVQTGQGGLAAGPDALLPGSYAGLVGPAAVSAGAPSHLLIASSGGCDS